MEMRVRPPYAATNDPCPDRDCGKASQRSHFAAEDDLLVEEAQLPIELSGS